jgi:hypothetical protein
MGFLTNIDIFSKLTHFVGKITAGLPNFNTAIGSIRENVACHAPLLCYQCARNAPLPGVYEQTGFAR